MGTANPKSEIRNPKSEIYAGFALRENMTTKKMGISIIIWACLASPPVGVSFWLANWEIPIMITSRRVERRIYRELRPASAAEANPLRPTQATSILQAKRTSPSPRLEHWPQSASIKALAQARGSLRLGYR